MNKIRIVKICILLSLIALLTTACGNDEEEITTGSKKKATIGFIMTKNDDTKDQINLMKDAIELAIEKLNSEKEEAGYQLASVFENDEGRPERAKELTRKLIEENKAKLIIGSLTEECTDAIVKEASEKNTIVMAMETAKEDITDQGQNIFRIGRSKKTQIQRLVNYAYQNNKYRRGAMLFNQEDDVSVNKVKLFKELFEKKGGKIVSEIGYDPESKDFTKPLQEILENTPDVIFIPEKAEVSAHIMKQANEARLYAGMMGTSHWEGIEMLGISEVSNAQYISSFAFDESNKQVKKFMQEFKTKNSKNPTPSAVLMYEIIRFYKQALINAKSTKVELMKKELKNVQISSALGRINFSKNRNLNAPSYILSPYQEAGQWKIKVLETINK